MNPRFETDKSLSEASLFAKKNYLCRCFGIVNQLNFLPPECPARERK